MMQYYSLLLVGLFSVSLAFTACRKENDEDILAQVLVDERDGEQYQIRAYGDQVWMIDNLRYKAVGSFQNPDNPALIYGRLYTWDVIMNGHIPISNNTMPVQGLCPKGWHLPSDKEWKMLEEELGMASSELDKWGDRGVIAENLKSKTGWANNRNGTNSNRFYAFPSGYYTNGAYDGLGENNYFFTSTVSAIYTSGVSYLIRNMYYANNSIGRNELAPTDDWAISCRCIQD